MRQRNSQCLWGKEETIAKYVAAQSKTPHEQQFVLDEEQKNTHPTLPKVVHEFCETPLHSWCNNLDGPFFLKSCRSSCSSPKSQFKLFLPHVTANISHLTSLFRIRDPQHSWSPVGSCSLATSNFTSRPAAESLCWWGKGKRGKKCGKDFWGSTGTSAGKKGRAKPACSAAGVIWYLWQPIPMNCS